MKHLILLTFVLLSTGFIWPFNKPQGSCTDRLNAKPFAIGYNEHYAFQHKDKTIAYNIQDRAYYKCSVRTTKSRDVSQEEWLNTINEYRYEVLNAG